VLKAWVKIEVHTVGYLETLKEKAYFKYPTVDFRII
jgi:hypothetical protein